MISIPRFILFAFLIFSMVGHAPLSHPSETSLSEVVSGSFARQIIFVLMCVAIAPFVANRLRYFRSLCAREILLLLILGWAAASVSWALAPEIALRRWILVAVVIFLLIGLSALINDTRKIHLIVLVAAGAVMLANYFVVFALPDIGLSTEERGTYWTGLLPHKNPAGLVSALAFLVWFFAWKRFYPSWLMLAGSGLWLVFLLQTGSRTSQFALVVALGCTFLLSLENRHLRRGAIFIALSFLSLGLLMIMIGILPTESAVETVFGDTTFTGRTALWAFLVAQIHERPLMGVGFGSFWGVSDTALMRSVQDHWFATTVQGHNGYLDITVTLGVVGLLLCLAFLLSPARSLVAADTRVDRGRRVFCAIWIFALIHNCAESSIMRGDSILWVLTLLSVVILRSTAPQSTVAWMQTRIARGLSFGHFRAAHTRTAREPQ